MSVPNTAIHLIYRDISSITKNESLMVTEEGLERASPKSIRFIIWKLFKTLAYWKLFGESQGIFSVIRNYYLGTNVICTKCNVQ